MTPQLAGTSAVAVAAKRKAATEKAPEYDYIAVVPIDILRVKSNARFKQDQPIYINREQIQYMEYDHTLRGTIIHMNNGAQISVSMDPMAILQLPTAKA